MRPRVLLLAAAIGMTPWGYGQAEIEFAEMIRDTQERIEQTLASYQSFLQATQGEKLELVRQINKLETELVELRRQEAKAKSSTTEQGFDLEDMKSRIDALDTQTQYSSGVLSEYLTNFESRIHISEDQFYLAPLSELRQTLDEEGRSQSERIQILFQSLELGLERQRELLGGRRFQGRAITPSGGIKPGEIALIGPSAYFLSQDGSASGLLNFNSGTIEPALIPLSEQQSAHIKETLTNADGMLPIDASLGNAIALDQARGSLLEHIQKGGWVGYAILALGGLTLLVSVLKLFDLRAHRIDDPGDLGAIARNALSGKSEYTEEALKSSSKPIDRMLATGAQFVRADSDTLLDAMEASILRFQPKLERFLPLLSTTAAVAPLMGLLGTVVGMIKTFTLIEVFGTGDAKSLSSGISEALVTTELGLVVAIPALIFHGIFTRIMRYRIGSMEQIATEFSRHVSNQRKTEIAP
ncbi:MotA/TolQ/ExbB proton channel family protein [Pelagicoccus sp. SDUM812003]|uniref:MotA/TolQ/ExbB proton channel family protein n=1 Tax=Pelagicoccus sp. SDUM812003 TaxID=3041267 RepID=UPI00280DF00F|nr:MotA/TolQ/ExbB proton channel family protein [Pelagicoccus sp. SDUM812003]MDQ8202303.1 MotA/TolQ/ExbB proton channel family protein [Pelagicoccus sp. SDUM812003]